MATLTLLPDTGHHQQQHGHHHAKKKCTSATCCSPSRIWRSIQQLIGDNNNQDLIKLCQDPNKATHVLRVLLTSRLTNDASLYPASNKHRVLQLVDDGSSGLSPLLYRATVNANFGKTATDLNALQLALFHRNESIACYLLQLVRQHASDKEMGLFVNHLWGTRNGSLHLACFLGMPRVVQLLLEMGVAPDAVNGKLKTPLDCCGCLDFNNNGQQQHPSILDCRTLIEQALLIKLGKKLSVDSSSPSPSIGVGVMVAAAPEQKSGDVTGDVASAVALDSGDTSNDGCMVVNNMDSVQVDDDLDELASPATMYNGDAVKSSLQEAPKQDSAMVSPSFVVNGDDQGDLWSLPLLFMDSPFASDPFVSDDEDDDLWSPHLLFMDNPFAPDDPFVSEDDDDDTDDLTCSTDDEDDGLTPGVLSLPLVMDSHGKLSAAHLYASDGVSSMTGGDFDSGHDGEFDSGHDGDISSRMSSLIDSGGHGDASNSPPTLDGGTFAGHSPLLFDMNGDPGPKTHDNHHHHQAHSGPRVTTVGSYLRGRIRNLDQAMMEYGTDTSWSHSIHHGGTGDTQDQTLLYFFVKQFKANLKSNDWKALCHEPTLTERKDPDYYDDPLDWLVGVNDRVVDRNNPNITERLLLVIARALHPPTRSPPPSFNKCSFFPTDDRTLLESPGMVHHCPSLMAMVGGDT